MRVGSLFSGIGGLELGLERAGMQVVWQVEFDPFCQQVLAKHWPEVKRYGDIRELRGDELERVDLICGGFPCQPHSVAGKRKASDDDRDLWPEMLRIIRAVKSRWVVAENVPGLLSSEVGRFFGGVLRDLAESGYSVGRDCIPASAVGAPHRRERVFIIGELVNSEYDGCFASEVGRSLDSAGDNYSGRENSTREFERTGQSGSHECMEQGTANVAYTSSAGRQERNIASDAKSILPQGQHCGQEQKQLGRESGRSAQSRLGRVLDGLSCGLYEVVGRCDWPTGPGREQHEWEPPQVIPNASNRAKRLKALGNAVVPQVAELIGKAIMEECDG